MSTVLPSPYTKTRDSVATKTEPEPFGRLFYSLCAARKNMGREVENARRHVYLAIETLRPRVPICPPHVATSQTQKCVMSHVNLTFQCIHSLVQNFKKQELKKPRLIVYEICFISKCPPHVATSQTQKCVTSHVNFTVLFILSHTKYKKQGLKRPRPRANTCFKQKKHYLCFISKCPPSRCNVPDAKMRHVTCQN